MNDQRLKLDALTSLRFFAAMLVLLFHYAGDIATSGPFWMQGLTKHGHSAVTFFFVLSGFILSYSYLCPNKPSAIKDTRKGFWISRFSRIYPTYLIALLISIPLYLFGAMRGRNGEAETVLALFLVPLMLQAWVPSVAIEWNPPAWSLSVEAFFYALFPFLARYWIPQRAKILLAVSVLLVFVGAGVQYLIDPNHLVDSPHPNFNIRNLLFYFPLFHLPSFLVGMSIGCLYLQPGKVVPSRLSRMFPAMILIMGIIFATRTVMPDILYSQPVMVGLYAMTIYLGAMAASDGNRFLAHPVLTLLGDASYAMYILQAPLSGWYDFLLRNLFHVQAWTHHIWLLMAFFVGLILASVLAFEFIEKPGRAAIRRLLTTDTSAKLNPLPTTTTTV